MKINYDADKTKRYVEIELTSEPQIITVYEGETVTADSNLDGVDDVSITAESITATEAIINYLEILTDTFSSCDDDFDCLEGEACLEGNCRPTVVWEPSDEEVTCTVDRTITCSTGGTVVVEMCVDGTPIPTDTTCETTYTKSGGRSGGPISSSPGVQTVTIPSFSGDGDVQVDKNKLYTYGAVALLIIGGLAYYFSKKPKTKSRRRKK